MEANVKETRAEWPADGMATLIFPNGLRKIYRKLKDPKEQDAVMSWLGRYILTGEDRENYKVQEYLKILLKDEVSRIFRKQKANTENGRRGGSQTKANRKRTSSEAEANDKRTTSEEEANEERTSSKIKGKGKDKVGGKPPTTPSTHTSRGCARARAGEDGSPAETPEAEAKRLGFGQFEGVAAELRGLVPATIELAVVYFAADQKHVSPENLLAWATHRQRQGWRAGQGSGVVITRYNVASDIAIWANNQANFQRAPAAGGGGSARPPAAQQDGGAAEGKKPAKRKWKFDRERMDEDRYGYIWAVPDEALGQFAAWYCGEEGNERSVGFYERVVREKGAHAFRRELEKFVGAVASGEEPENRGAAFTAACKEI